MATPPLPDTPCVRVRLIYSDGVGQEAGNRFYLTYSGSAPSGANCVTLATDISGAYGSHLAALCAAGVYDLVEVDVLDIASDSGASGSWTGSVANTRSGTGLPLQCCTNVEFDIARRYRGGKPRIYLPPAVQSDLVDEGHYSSTFAAAVNTAVAAFFTEVTGFSVGSMGTLEHVNLSYYNGYNTSSPPWRGPGYKYPPKYRDIAKTDPITSYATKLMVGSQRKRRSSATP